MCVRALCFYCLIDVTTVHDKKETACQSKHRRGRDRVRRTSAFTAEPIIFDANFRPLLGVSSAMLKTKFRREDPDPTSTPVLSECSQLQTSNVTGAG